MNNEYERIELKDGAYKKRKAGNKSWLYYCKHGRRPSRCQECGGSSICEHGRRRSVCQECGGSSICEHGRRRDQCKECGGSALCKTPFCEKYKSNPQYEGYCMTCFVYNPENKDKPIYKNFKTKETEVVNIVTAAYSDFTWYCDKRVTDGCSKRRPDLLADFGSHVIIVEIDEYQHTDYDTTCEEQRLNELYQDLQFRPIVFIRFNPDSYINEAGEKISSCWKVGKDGLLRINPKKAKEWKKRLCKLLEKVEFHSKNKPIDTVKIIELFYNLTQ